MRSLSERVLLGVNLPQGGGLDTLPGRSQVLGEPANRSPCHTKGHTYWTELGRVHSFVQRMNLNPNRASEYIPPKWGLSFIPDCLSSGSPSAGIPDVIHHHTQPPLCLLVVPVSCTQVSGKQPGEGPPWPRNRWGVEWLVYCWASLY